jgi:hypothetical protein
MVSVLTNRPNLCWFKPDRGDGFKCDNGLQYTFLRRGSKAAGPNILLPVKITSKCKQTCLKAKLIIYFVTFLLIFY